MPIGERPCFLGSPGLGRCHLGSSAVWLRDHAVHLPGRITCLWNVPGLRGPMPCRVPDCLGRYSTLCLKSTVFWGGLGTACLGELTLYWWKSAIYQGSLGTVYLGDITLGKECCLPGRTGNCLPGRAHSLPVKECYLMGKPEDCLPGRYDSGEEHSFPGRTGNCLPEKTGNCLSERLHSLPEKECCLPGELGGYLLGR